MEFRQHIRATTDIIDRILKRTIFKPANKLRDLIGPFKDKLPLSRRGYIKYLGVVALLKN